MSTTSRLLLACLVSTLSAGLASAADLVRDGKARAVIVVPGDADATEKLAARELQDHVERISGARLAVVDDKAYAAQASELPVYLGRSARKAVEGSLPGGGKISG